MNLFASFIYSRTHKTGFLAPGIYFYCPLEILLRRRIAKKWRRQVSPPWENRRKWLNEWITRPVMHPEIIIADKCCSSPESRITSICFTFSSWLNWKTSIHPLPPSTPGATPSPPEHPSTTFQFNCRVYMIYFVRRFNYLLMIFIAFVSRQSSPGKTIQTPLFC